MSSYPSPKGNFLFHVPCIHRPSTMLYYFKTKKRGVVYTVLPGIIVTSLLSIVLLFTAHKLAGIVKQLPDASASTPPGNNMIRRNAWHSMQSVVSPLNFKEKLSRPARVFSSGAGGDITRCAITNQLHPAISTPSASQKIIPSTLIWPNNGAAMVLQLILQSSLPPSFIQTYTHFIALAPKYEQPPEMAWALTRFRAEDELRRVRIFAGYQCGH